MLGAEVAPEPIYFGIKQIGEIIISILFFRCFSGRPKLTVVKFAEVTGHRGKKEMLLKMELQLIS